MSVELLTVNHWEFQSLKVGFTDSSESTLVKMSHCWKSHDAAERYKVHNYGGVTEQSTVSRIKKKNNKQKTHRNFKKKGQETVPQLTYKIKIDLVCTPEFANVPLNSGGGHW